MIHLFGVNGKSTDFEYLSKMEHIRCLDVILYVLQLEGYLCVPCHRRQRGVVINRDLARRASVTLLLLLKTSPIFLLRHIRCATIVGP